MTNNRKKEIEEMTFELRKMRRKISEIQKEQDDYADSIDEEEDYFKHRWERISAEILKDCEELCEKLMNRLEEGSEDYIPKKR